MTQHFDEGISTAQLRSPVKSKLIAQQEEAWAGRLSADVRLDRHIEKSLVAATLTAGVQMRTDFMAQLVEGQRCQKSILALGIVGGFCHCLLIEQQCGDTALCGGSGGSDWT